MQGAGNDFVVLDETQGSLGLTPAHYRFLGDRHFGVGADQILTVRPAPSPDLDFEYVIHNADGGEVEQCGNGSRCFVRFVREQGLTQKNTVRVKVHGGIITLHELPDGQVKVDMGEPVQIADLARQMIVLSGFSVKDEDNLNGDIQIKFSGLRPGEKLYEELLINADDLPTKHPLIRQAHENFLPIDQLQPLLEQLQDAIIADNQIRAKYILALIVPEYTFALQ
jgi:hypothetical protein